MATLFARLVSPSPSPPFALARHPSTPGQCIGCQGHAPADQDHLKGSSPNRRADGRVCISCAVLAFARSVRATLTWARPSLGQLLNRVSLADQGRADPNRRPGSKAWGVRTLVLVACIFATSTPDAVAVELINPHDVLNQTRRDMIDLDKRLERDKAARQKDEKEREARQKQEEAERQKRENAEKALQEAQRKREEAEKQKREKAEKVVQEAQRKREAAEQRKREREAKAQQTAQKKQGTAAKPAEGASPSPAPTTPAQPSTGIPEPGSTGQP